MAPRLEAALSLRAATLATLLVAALGARLGAFGQRSSAAHKSVVVRQIAGNQSCAANCQLREAYITIPHAMGDMLKGGIGARQVHATPIDGVPTFPRKVAWMGANEDDLAREFDEFVASHIADYASAMTAWQSTFGLATATHDLIQKVTHRGREKRVIVNVLTFDNALYYYNGARVMADDPDATAQILYVRAIPSATSSGLPESWNWANAGNVFHELRDAALTPGAGFSRLSVGAAYDEPFDYSGAPYDPDARLKCLIDKTRSGCGQAEPDVRGLIALTDPTYAVLDYYRRVKPAGIGYASAQAAQMAARVTDRLVSYACPNDATGTYAQVFRYTMRLENQIDRYLAFPDGRYYFIQTFKDVVTPAEVAVAGTSTISRWGEYPNLATRFLHHRTNAYTDASAYAPNAVSLSAVALNPGGPCGCAPQPNYSQSLPCAALNASWQGTFTRWWTFNTASCAYSFTDNTSSCSVACPAQSARTQTLSCLQAGYPAGWVGAVVQQQDWFTASCSYGAWDTINDTCNALPATVALDIGG